MNKKHLVIDSNLHGRLKERAARLHLGLTEMIEPELQKLVAEEPVTVPAEEGSPEPHQPLIPATV